ncbi:MAG: non-heme iron oxygenase ferredoxin subunit [Candidatus Eremiobacteraeota bacterium]|nr:non-heme iron oxygenase ferredoxin subunit [Candidatus Eremiobacteraeota bacterium]
MSDLAACGDVGDVPFGATRRVTAAGLDVLLCNVDGTIYAVEDVCTHDGAPLDQGWLDGKCITCPRHGAVFDVTTGAVLALPAVIPLRTFAVDVRDGCVTIRVPLDSTY